MIVQIYEIQSPSEAAKCVELGVDHVGSVLVSQEEWRNADLREVIHLSQGTDTKNSLLPLFQDVDALSRAIDYYRPHYLHFCETLTDPTGKEIPLDPHVHRQRELKRRFPELGIIRSIPIPQRGASSGFPTLSAAAKLEDCTDLFLTDTWLGQEPVAGYIGITGKTSDWDVARELVVRSGIPVILAGGLSPENVYSAIMAVLPAGADSCTLTNQMNGEGRPTRFTKDFERVARFVSHVRRAEDAIRRRRRDLSQKVDELEAELREREAALPAHSLKANQLLAIEDLEDAIAFHKEELEKLQAVL